MNQSPLHQNSTTPRKPGRPRKIDAWVRASKPERFWTALACWLASLTFAGPGQYLSGRTRRALIVFAGEFLLVCLWLLLASITGHWPLAALTLAIVLYHFLAWIDAARCGWKFRKVTISNSVLRIVAMAGLVAVVPLPAAMLALGPATHLLVGEYQITEGSMATTLLGQHAKLRCPTCGYHFTVDILAYRSNYAPAKNIPCPMCAAKNLHIVNSADPPRDRILVGKTLIKPRRWDLLLFRSPADLNTLLLKRLVALPGEELQIIDGEIFINGSLVSKPPLAHQEMWLPVLDTSFRTDTSPPAPNLRWQPARDATNWHPDGQAWLFDSTNNNPQSLELAGQLTDRLIYNINAVQYIQPHPIHDIKLSIQLSRLDGPGQLTLLWQHRRTEVRATIAANGSATLQILNSEQPQPPAKSQLLLLKPIAEDTELTLIIRDGYAYFYAGPNQLCKAPLGPFQAHTDQQKSPQSCRLSITARHCRTTISRIQLHRDIHYRAISSSAARSAQTTPVKINPGHYYVLGDNSPVSHDSRLGWQIHPSLQGKAQPAMVPIQLTEGVATCIYWPPTRWRSFR